MSLDISLYAFKIRIISPLCSFWLPLWCVVWSHSVKGGVFSPSLIMLKTRVQLQGFKVLIFWALEKRWMSFTQDLWKHSYRMCSSVTLNINNFNENNVVEAALLVLCSSCRSSHLVFIWKFSLVDCIRPYNRWCQAVLRSSFCPKIQWSFSFMYQNVHQKKFKILFVSCLCPWWAQCSCWQPVVWNICLSVGLYWSVPGKFWYDASHQNNY